MNRRVTASLVVAALVAGVAALVWYSRRQPAQVSSAPVSSAAPAPSSVADPLLPARPARIDPTRASLAADWVSARPAAQFQYSRRASERGGVEPCAMAVPESAKRATSLSRGSLFLGNLSELPVNGEFDLILHLNGDAPVRRELVASEQPFALLTLTVPMGESYAALFAGSGLLGRLIDESVRAVSQHFQREAKLGHLALSAWSAGFEGVRSILYQPEAERVEAIILVDGLHAPRRSNGLRQNLEPFVRFARRAEQNERLFIITHSSIPTGGFTSTTESAHFLIDALGGKPTAVRRDDGFGLELIDTFDAGGLHVRGYAGNDKADHCAQLLLLRTLFRVLRTKFHPAG